MVIVEMLLLKQQRYPTFGSHRQAKGKRHSSIASVYGIPMTNGSSSLETRSLRVSFLIIHLEASPYQVTYLDQSVCGQTFWKIGQDTRRSRRRAIVGINLPKSTCRGAASYRTSPSRVTTPSPSKLELRSSNVRVQACADQAENISN